MIAFDTETTGFDPMQADRAHLVGLSVGQPGSPSVARARPHLDESTVLGVIGPLLEDIDLLKTHNLKFDMNVMRRAGVRRRDVASTP